MSDQPTPDAPAPDPPEPTPDDAPSDYEGAYMPNRDNVQGESEAS